MTFRHAVLPTGAVLVLGLGVYLFVEVRAEPAPPPPAMGHASRAAPPPPPPPVAPPARLDVPVHVTPPTPASAATAPPPPRLAAAESPSTPTSNEPALAGPKLDAAMAEANKAYDRGDYDEAKALATRLLARDPTNVRMLRIMVSSSCMDGDSPVAQAHYARLPAGDQEQMKVRCARYGITFADNP